MSTFAERQAARPIQEDELIVILRQPKAIRRFEMKFIPEPMSGCWLWIGACGSRSGHGQFSVRKTSQRKGIINAHRASWLIYKCLIGPLDLVLHHCDNACCVNPDHLFVGSQKINMRDARDKGRLVMPDSVGAKNGSAKITEDDARLIIIAPGPYRAIALQFGITKTTVYDIKSGKTWSHIARESA